MPDLHHLRGFCEWAAKLAAAFVMWPLFLLFLDETPAALTAAYRDAVAWPAARWLGIPVPNDSRG